MRIFKSDDDFLFGVPPSGTRTVARLLGESNGEMPEIHGNERMVEFSALCPCGSENFIVKEEDGIVYLVCALCGYTFVVFNPAIHGIHALQKKNTSGAEPEKKIYCPECAQTIFQVQMHYTYDIEIKKAETETRKTEDLMHGFSLFIICENCKKEQTVLQKNC